MESWSEKSLFQPFQRFKQFNPSLHKSESGLKVLNSLNDPLFCHTPSLQIYFR